MEPLFKYVVPERIDVLSNGTLRFTQPHLFNDPFELQTVIKGMYSEQDIDSLGEQEIDDLAAKIPQIRTTLSEWLGREPTVGEIRAVAKAILPKLLDDDYTKSVIDEIRAQFFVPRLYQKIGILSLTEKWDNLLMWAHYADQHRGFVLEFDRSDEFFNRADNEDDLYGRLIKVKYSDTRPSTSFMAHIGLTTFLTKSTDWEYEQEWRRILGFERETTIQGANGDIHLFSFPPACLTGVILGCRMDESDKRKITDLLRKDTRYRHVSIRQARLHDEHFALESEDIVDAYYRTGVETLGRAYKWAGLGDEDDKRRATARPFAEEAVLHLTRVIELDPNRADAHAIRGAAYQLYLGDAALALEDYTAAIDLEPQSTDYIVERGRLYVQMQEPDKALADFDRAGALGHSDARDYAKQIRSQMARLQSGKRADELLAKFNHAVAQKDWRTVAELGEKILEVDAGDPKVLELTAYAYKTLARLAADKDYELCIRAASRSLELNDEDSDLYAIRAAVRIIQEQPAAALPDVNCAIELDPNNAAYYSLRAAVYAQMEDLDKAQQDLATALALQKTVGP
jgi:tetratricopeptide (TPR) repeat protein